MSSKISIALADVSIRILNKRKLYKWIEETIVSEKRVVDQISIILCSDEYLLEINKKFLEHNYYTDIITFDYSEGKFISGELYISIDRLKENASTFNTEFTTELYRVIIHGVLHLCGYADKTTKEASIMRKKEDAKLKLLNY
jgi:probable rRNA maturation factor